MSSIRRTALLSLMLMLWLGHTAWSQLAPPHPPTCFATGPGLESGVAGEPSTFTIFARDAANNPVTQPASFAVEVDGALAGPVQIEDLRNGSYTVRFTRTTAGPANIQVSLDRSHIRGSPFRAVWATGPESARQSLVSGSALHGGILDRQSVYGLRIDIRDAWGNPIRRGGHGIAARLENPEEGRLPIDLEDLGNGVYIAEFQVKVAGTYELAVTLGTPAEHVAASPFQIRWRQSKKPSSEEFEPWLLALVGITLCLGLIAGLYCWCARRRHRRAIEGRPLLIERLSSSAF